MNTSNERALEPAQRSAAARKAWPTHRPRRVQADGRSAKTLRCGLLPDPRRLHPFTRRALEERARLALVDPAGEADAIAPLTETRARQLLLHLEERCPREGPGRRPIHRVGVYGRPDDRQLLASLGADPSRDHGMVRCPAHPDGSPLLSWRRQPDGRVLIHCFAGCSFREIVEAVR